MTTNAIGAEITRTSTRPLYWTISTDTTLSGTPKVAILGLYETPTSTTTWADAAWAEAEVVVGTVHTRRVTALVAGPNGPTNGSPIVVPVGEHTTWVRIDTANTRIEVEGQLLAVT